MRLMVLFAAALNLAGCSASNPMAPSSQGIVAGPSFPNYNPYNPVSYGQTSGFYAGR